VVVAMVAVEVGKADNPWAAKIDAAAARVTVINHPRMAKRVTTRQYRAVGADTRQDGELSPARRSWSRAVNAPRSTDTPTR
jgi:hypothetical protein